ncbi:MAG: hypothetical protein ACLRRV_01045 [Lachnospiraceae bacterium]
MMVANSNMLKSSSMYIGYQILKEIQRQGGEGASIYDVSKALKTAGIGSSRQLIMGLSFLYAVGIIDFEEAMIWVKKSNESA